MHLICWTPGLAGALAGLADVPPYRRWGISPRPENGSWVGRPLTRGKGTVKSDGGQHVGRHDAAFGDVAAVRLTREKAVIGDEDRVEPRRLTAKDVGV